MLSTIQSYSSNPIQNMVPESHFNTTINIFRNDDYSAASPPPQQEEYSAYDPNFEIANRAFYATISKFTRQACSDTSSSSSTRRRSPPYSFLENWHLHSIYSKSQQTLLGIKPVKPSVLLSGDDFMFTPPFVQVEEEEEERGGGGGGEEEEEGEAEEEDLYSDEEDIWDTNEFYNLSPCPDSNQAGELLSSSSYPPSSTTTTAAARPLSYFETAPLSPHTKEYFYDQQGNQDENNNIWIENEETRPHNLNRFHTFSNLNLLSIQIPFQNSTTDLLFSPEEEPSSSSSSSSSSDEQLTISCSPSDNDSVCSSITSEKLDAFFNTNDASDSSEQEQQQDLSSYDLVNLYDATSPTNDLQNVAQTPTVNSPVTRSSSFKSQTSVESVVSYQSLADLINHQQQSQPFYGSINSEPGFNKSILNSIAHTLANNTRNAKDHNSEELGIQPTTSANKRSTAANAIWTSLVIYIMYYWHILVGFFTRKPASSEESESLLY